MIQRRGAETQRENQITERVIGAAIEVHRHLGPGLLETAYEECLCYELSQAGLAFTRQTPLPVAYKGVKLNCGYRMDLVVEDLVIIEVKAAEAVLPVQEAQLLTYLRLFGKSVGLLINFHEPVLKKGIRRVVNQFSESSASQRLCVEGKAQGVAMIQRRGVETQRENQITERVIGAAIEVHRHLGPGLLETAYEECLCYELSQAGLAFTRQTPLPVAYKGVKLNCGYRMDLVVEELVVIEVKAVDAVLPVHEAQLLTYLRLLGKSVGLLINFHEPVLKKGIRRVVNQFSESSASQRLCVKERADAATLS